MIGLKHCPNCDSNNFIPYQIVADSNLISVTIQGIEVEAAVVTRYCQCQDCHLIFQNPRLSNTELGKYYNTGIYRQTVNPPPEGMDKGEADRAENDAKIIKRYLGKITSHLDIGCSRGYLLDAIDAKVKVGVESNVDFVKSKKIQTYNRNPRIGACSKTASLLKKNTKIF